MKFINSSSKEFVARKLKMKISLLHNFNVSSRVPHIIFLFGRFRCTLFENFENFENFDEQFKNVKKINFKARRSQKHFFTINNSPKTPRNHL